MDVNFINCTSFCINIISIRDSKGLRHIRTSKHRDVIDTSTCVLGWCLLQHCSVNTCSPLPFL